MYRRQDISALVAYVMLAVASWAVAAAAADADIILHAGFVRTLDDPPTDVTPTAVVVSGNRIVYVGKDEDALAYRGDATEVIDLAGAVVVPGFCDGHAHLYGLGKALGEIDLNGTQSPEEVADLVRQAAAAAPAGGWLEGRGWDQNDWPQQEFPTRDILDEAAPNRPVLLRRVDGHAAWVNSTALAVAGVSAVTEDPAGGRILRDEHGEPTGLLIDNAIDLVRDVIPEPTIALRKLRIRDAMLHCLKHGITGVHDAGAKNEQLAVYRELAEAGRLDLRLYCMLDDDPETLDRWLPEGGYTSDDGMLTIRAVKLYADGALGSRGALLLDDYSDDPGNRGLQVTTTDHLREVARRAAAAGFQVCTHAIGDGGNRLALDVYEEVLGGFAAEDARWRIEHAQVVHPDDVPRFAELGVIASMQPVHCTSDMDWAEDRLGPDRSLGAYAWRSLLETGARLSFGTDFPVEQVDPLAGLYAARTRMHPDGSPAGGWQPEQCLDGAQALRLYTAGPAYASFREMDLGAVRSGMLADLTVLSGDPVACAPDALLRIRTLMTIVDGKIRYDGWGLLYGTGPSPIERRQP